MSIGLRPGYFGGNYLGSQDNPFETEGDPNADNFKVNNLAIVIGLTVQRLEDRRKLLATLRPVPARRGPERQARCSRWTVRAAGVRLGHRRRGPRSVRHLGKRRPEFARSLRPKFLGTKPLLARRLVEAGTTFVTCHFGGWDHHWDLKAGMERLPAAGRPARLRLVHRPGRTRSVRQSLVVLCGEFSRTPRMNDGGNGGAPMSKGTPGRDHWGNAMFCLMGGGGVKGGRLVGCTNRLGEVPQDRPLASGRHPSHDLPGPRRRPQHQLP